MLPVPVPLARRGVFTAAEAYAAGWSASALDRAVRSGRLIRLRKGIYCAAWSTDLPVPPHLRRDVDLARTGVAAGLASEHVVVSHLAAVQLHGLPVWAPHPRACAVVDDNRTRVPGLHVHRTPIGDDADPSAGFRVTTPLRTVLDVACEFGTEAGLVVADAALGRGLTTRSDLAAAVDRARGRTGIAHAREVGKLADGRAESPLESRSRWHCAVHRLPRPEPQVRLHGADGGFLGRVDLWWDVGVVGEVDGAEKLTDPAARRALLERQLRLTRAGLRIVRWGASDLRDFARTAAWIREELAAAAGTVRDPRWRVVRAA